MVKIRLNKRGLTYIELIISLFVVIVLVYFFLKAYMRSPLFPKKAQVSSDGKMVEDTDVIQVTKDEVQKYNEKIQETEKHYKELE